MKNKKKFIIFIILGSFIFLYILGCNLFSMFPTKSWTFVEYAIVDKKEKDGIWIKTIEDMKSYKITYNLYNFYSLLSTEEEDIIEIPELDTQLIKGNELSCSLRKVDNRNHSILYDPEGNIIEVLLNDEK